MSKISLPARNEAFVHLRLEAVLQTSQFLAGLLVLPVKL